MLSSLRARLLRWLPGSLRGWLARWAQDVKTARSPDRAILRDIIFSDFASIGALSCGKSVLWIGCQRYTRKYYSRLERLGARCWTIDIDPSVARFGRRGRHVTASLLEAGELYSSAMFDVIICNGVLGWGINDSIDQEAAGSVLAKLVKPGGWVVIGWNHDKMPDPSRLDWWTRDFERATLPSICSRYEVGGCTHIFDFLRRSVI